MKTVYRVMSEFYDNGQVKAGMKVMRCKELPKAQSRELPFMDSYWDYFLDKEEAEWFLAEARVA